MMVTHSIPHKLWTRVQVELNVGGIVSHLNGRILQYTDYQREGDTVTPTAAIIILDGRERTAFGPTPLDKIKVVESDF